MATLTTTTTTERSCSRAGLRTRTLVHCFHPRARSVPGTAQKVTRLVAPATLRGRPLFDIAILVPASLSLSLFLLFVLPLCLALFSSTSLCFLALHPQNITTPPHPNPSTGWRTFLLYSTCTGGRQQIGSDVETGVYYYHR